MKVRDEVCGMEFEEKQATATVRLGATVYYFCSERCKRMFKEHPDRFVHVDAAPKTP